MGKTLEDEQIVELVRAHGAPMSLIEIHAKTGIWVDRKQMVGMVARGSLVPAERKAGSSVSRWGLAQTGADE